LINARTALQREPVMIRNLKEKPEFTISQLAEEFDISTRTIRFYEEKGLIAPRRSKGNQRIYTRRDRARLKLILRGKRFGYSLDEISEMMGMNDIDMNETDQIKKALEYGDRKLAEIRTHVEELTLLEQDIRSVKKKLIERLAVIGGS
jgi:DNA-binding transcriptional MerR regulator